jgi:hypothetical protein
LRRALPGDAVAPSSSRALIVRRSLPHCYVAAVLGTLRRLGLDRLLSQSGRHPKQEVILCLAMIVVRLIAPVYKLATGQLLDGETATCSLGQVLGGGRPRDDRRGRGSNQPISTSPPRCALRHP